MLMEEWGWLLLMLVAAGRWYIAGCAVRCRFFLVVGVGMCKSDFRIVYVMLRLGIAVIS